MLCFNGWNQAVRLLPSFVNALGDVGLQINYSKSCFEAALTAKAPGHQISDYTS